MEYIQVLFVVAVQNSQFIVGLLIPPVIEILNKDVHSDRGRFTVAFLVCFFMALFMKWEEISGLNLKSVEVMTKALGIIFTESQVVYRLYFRNSLIRNVIQEKLGIIR